MIQPGPFCCDIILCNGYEATLDRSNQPTNVNDDISSCELTYPKKDIDYIRP